MGHTILHKYNPPFKISRYPWRFIPVLVLWIHVILPDLAAQTEKSYTIIQVAQVPVPEGTEKTGIRDKISEILFGRKPVRVIKPFNVLASSPDRIFILDQGAGMVFEAGSDRVEPLDAFKRNSPEFPSLVGICQVPGGNLVCTDSRLNRVFVIKDNGIFGLLQDQPLKQPTGIAYNPLTGELWIAETGNHRIVVLDEDGNLERTIGARGTSPGNFNFPTFIWIDHSGRVYIVDSMNFRIQVFHADGTYLFSFGKNGNATGDMARPKGIATDSEGNIYVADALFNTIQVFDSEGTFLYNFGKQGHDKGDFWIPAGICVDSRDYIYVADSYNGRIQVFERKSIHP
jgi:DNA-binding beta-propeller fold protein YncE